MAGPREQRKRQGRGRSSTEGEPAASLIPELLRKGFGLGFSGLFMTEEAVRRAFGDTVPRDWIDFATEQSARTRTEFLERLSGEIARSLESLDLVEIFDALIAGRTIEVKAEIRLRERDDEEGRRPRSVRLSMSDKGKPRR